MLAIHLKWIKAYARHREVFAGNAWSGLSHFRLFKATPTLQPQLMSLYLGVTTSTGITERRYYS